MSIFNLKDKFVLSGVLSEVVYINNEFAWLAPLQDDIKNQLYKRVAFDKINKMYKNSKGEKAKPVEE